jgi:hypothetical protein
LECLGGSGDFEELEEPEEPGPLGETGLRVGPLPLWPEGIELAELCGALGLLTGLVGVPDGVLLLGGEDGVLEPPPDGELLVGPPGLLGLLGPLGLPPPEPLPTPLMETICPLGSKRTCAVHGPFGSPAASTRTCSEVWAPPASMPEVALGVSQAASGVAVQLTGEVPEFQSVTTTSCGLFERCETLMCSWPPSLGACEGSVCEGGGSIGPLNGSVSVATGAAADVGVVGAVGSSAATTCAVTVSSPGIPLARAPPATGSAGPASALELGRG